jgi:hypothetical protein
LKYRMLPKPFNIALSLPYERKHDVDLVANRQGYF